MRVIKWGKGSLFVYVFKKYRFLLKNTGLWASKYRFVFPEVGVSVVLINSSCIYTSKCNIWCREQKALTYFEIWAVAKLGSLGPLDKGLSGAHVPLSMFIYIYDHFQVQPFHTLVPPHPHPNTHITCSRHVEQKPPRGREYDNLPFKMHCDSIITRSCWIVD